jgi:hypothetical protein
MKSWLGLPLQIRLFRAAASVAAASTLAACTVTCPETDIGKAAAYYSSDNVFEFGTPAQQERWIENPRLNLFLQQRIQSSGLSALSRKYGLQCMARSTPQNCTDCHVCTGTIVAEVTDLGGTFGGGICGSDGTVAIHAEIGPGAKMTTTTYWTPRRRRRPVD